jgi:hypothetical protein
VLELDGLEKTTSLVEVGVIVPRPFRIEPDDEVK